MLRDLIAAVLLGAIAAGYYALAVSIDASALADDVGPGGLPVIYAVALGTLAVALAGRTLLAKHFGAAERTTESSGGADRHTLLRAAGMLAIGVFYLACVDVLGYVVSLAAVVFGVAVYQGEPAGARVVAIAGGGALAFWLFFVMLLGIEMPSGFWPILWGGEWIR